MKGSAVSLLLVIFVSSIFDGINGTEEDAALEQRNAEQVANFTQLQSDVVEEEAADVNSPLLSDANDHNHSHHSTADKRKRCPSYRVSSALNSRSGIVGAELPQSLQRRDLQSQFYEKMCVTCMSRHSCNLVGNCPLCEKWCTKVNEDDPTEDQKEENGPIVSPNLDEPIISMASRSNFDGENRKNVYTIATLRTGNTKEMILKSLGVSDVEDVDTVVVWVTTRSNNPPFISNGFQEAPLEESEQIVEDVESQQQIKSSPIIGEANPETSHVLSSANSIGADTEILPRYPIESNPNGFVMHQSMNPDIIEGPPSMAIMERERVAETELLGSPTRQQERIPNQDTPPDFLLREDQLGVQTIDESEIAQPISDNQGLTSNLGIPIVEKSSPLSETMERMRVGSNHLDPGARMREFLENVKAKNPILSRKNTAFNQLESLTPNLQNKAREAMEKLKSIQLPRSFPKLNTQDENNIVSSDHVEYKKSSEFAENDTINPGASEPANSQSIVETTNQFTGERSSFSEHDEMMNPQSRMAYGEGHEQNQDNEQFYKTNDQSNSNNRMMIPDDDNQVRKSFNKFENRNDMRTLGSQNLDPKNTLDLAENEDIINPLVRSYQSDDSTYKYGQPELASDKNIEKLVMAEEKVGNTERMPLNENLQSSNIEDPPLPVPSENEMTGMLNPDETEQFQTRPSDPVDWPASSDPRKNVSKTKTKLGARTNELLQKMKEKQDARKQSLIEAKKSLNAALEDAKTSAFNNFDNTDAALGAIKEVTEDSQHETRSSKSLPDSFTGISRYTSQTIDTGADVSKSIVDEERNNSPQMIGQSEVVGSQPLEDSFEKIQPFASRSSRPWHNDMPTVDSAANIKPLKEPSLGSPNLVPLNTVNDNENPNPNLGSRGQFEENPVSNALGAVIPREKEMDISFQKPSDVYFIGSGIKLPLQMLKKSDGAVHFSVDMEKLCSCNNTSCPRNHTDIEKTVETILEKEAELKDQLVHTNQDIVGEPVPKIDSQNQPTLGEQFENMSLLRRLSQKENVDNMPVGMAVPTNIAHTTTFQRNQRDTVQEFSEMKNRIASNMDSKELQSEGAGILKRSPVDKSDTNDTKKIAAIEPTIKPVLQKESKKVGTKPRVENYLVSSTSLPQNIKKDVLHKNQLQNTTQNTSTTTKEPDTQTTANYFQNFLSRKFDEIKSRMSELEKKNQALTKDLGLPQTILNNFWNSGKDAMVGTTGANKQSTFLFTPPNLGSRIQEMFNRSVKKDLELYDNLASINKPYQFKNLEKKMENTINQYAKADDKMIKDESATLQSMNEDPVIKKEVGIASNIIQFFKDLAADKK